MGRNGEVIQTDPTKTTRVFSKTRENYLVPVSHRIEYHVYELALVAKIKTKIAKNHSTPYGALRTGSVPQIRRHRSAQLSWTDS